MEKSIDNYIANAAPFARPILKHLRQLVHEACPHVEETIKWSFPHFDYKGVMCSMAAFKEHCSFGFWKASLMKDPHGVLDKGREEGMGHFGKITSLADLPDDETIIACIQEAMELNEKGIKLPKKELAPKQTLSLPEDFALALDKNREAKTHFESFTYSKKKDYIEWITEAKQAATREKRLATAIEWLSEGKSRNWKYEC